MTTHILSMTYAPKIAGVMDGTIRQTIRRYNPKRPFKVGDKLLIHGWEGAMYHTPWSWRREEKVRFAVWVEASPTDLRVTDFCATQLSDWEGDFICDHICPWLIAWDSELADDLAIADGISPPTGQALKETLEKFHGKFTDEPVRFQVIRW